jgi:asparagine synthase (glutamine-hydrolysing)
MSVIYGKCYFNKQQDAKVIRNELSLMQNSLNHWNADDIGEWSNGTVGLGQLMLYNTPESLHEKLPLHNAITRLTITADARIDNRDELFETLNIGHDVRKDIADSSLILLAYEKYNENCVQHLIGDFAFVIYDEKEQKLFCARDHMGVKPFFYYKDDSFFAFASEKKGILVLPKIDKAIDLQFFYNKLIVFNDQPVDLTLYENIKRLPAAHALTVNVNTNKQQLKRYWALDAFKEIKLESNEEYYKQLLFHFEEAVKCRTRTAFPIGAELSGGMDSSAITGAAQYFLKQNKQQLITFSNTLPNEVMNENVLEANARKDIDEVIAFNHIEEYVYITERIWDNRVDEVDFGLYIDDGLESWNYFWQLPSKAAAMKKNVRTLFSGFPGDQMVTTHSKTWFLDLFYNKQYLKYLDGAIKSKKFFNILSPIIPFKLRYWVRRLKDHLGWYTRPIRQASQIYNIPNKYKKKLNDSLWLDPVYGERLKSYRHVEKFILLKPAVVHRLEAETRHGLYFRMEPRFPMADIRLTQYFLAMPNHLKYGGPLGRDTYRYTVKKYLPPRIQQKVNKGAGIAPFLDLRKNEGLNQLNLFLQELPENDLLKKAIIGKNMERILKKGFTKTNRHRKPQLDIVRWMQKNQDLLKHLLSNAYN